MRDFEQITEEKFKEIKKGDQVKLVTGDVFTAGCDAFWNSDADEPGWEIESNDGSNYSIYGVSDFIPSGLDIRKIAYQMHQLDWMATHQHSIDELVDELDNVYGQHENESVTPGEAFSEWCENSGFGGEIYACFDEFLDCEYQDVDYMEVILSKPLFELYLKDTH